MVDSTGPIRFVLRLPRQLEYGSRLPIVFIARNTGGATVTVDFSSDFRDGQPNLILAVFRPDRTLVWQGDLWDAERGYSNPAEVVAGTAVGIPISARDSITATTRWLPQDRNQTPLPPGTYLIRGIVTDRRVSTPDAWFTILAPTAVR